MNVSFNDRMNAEEGSTYFCWDFKHGPAQDAGLSLPTWFQFPYPILQLPEKPSAQACGNLLEGKNADGSGRLTLRTNTTRTEGELTLPDHRASYEFTFSPLKWISLLALCLADTRILRVWENVVWEALILAARFAATRVRRNGANHDRTTGHVVGLLIHHILNRADDAQLHAHAMYFNVTWDPVEKRFKALQFDQILAHKEFIRCWAMSRLFEELHLLGYDFELTPEGIRVPGIPKEAEEIMSKRTMELEKAVRLSKKPLNHEDMKLLILSSRRTKSKENWAGMSGRWSIELKDHLNPIKEVVLGALGRARMPIPRLESTAAARRVLDATLDELLECHARVTRELLLARALAKADGTWSGEVAQAVIHQQIEDGNYLRVGNSLTNAEAQERLSAVFLDIHIALGPRKIIRGRIPDAPVNDALQLVLCGLPILIARTRRAEAFKHLFLGFHSGLLCLGKKPVYALPEAIQKLGPATPLSKALAGDGKTLLVEKAEKLTLTELRGITEHAAQSSVQIILLTGEKALGEQQNPSIVSALARHHWMALVDLERVERPIQFVANMVPRSLLRTERRKDRAISMVAESVAHLLGRREMVQFVADDPEAAGRLEKEIEDRLSKITGLPARSLTGYQPLPCAAPRIGDTAVSLSATRHFQAGECVRVVEISGAEITVEKANGHPKTITPKVWSKLTRVSQAQINFQPGTVLSLTEGVPGRKHRLKCGTTVQVDHIHGDGTIHLTCGEDLPPWFTFFRHGYRADLSRKNLPGKVIVLLRKRPGPLMRTLIRTLAKRKALLGLTVKKTAHLHRASAKAVEIAMARVHPEFLPLNPEPKPAEAAVPDRPSELRGVPQMPDHPIANPVDGSSKAPAQSFSSKTKTTKANEHDNPEEPDHP